MNFITGILNRLRRKPKPQASGIERMAKAHEIRLQLFREITKGQTVWDEPMDRRGHYEHGTHFVPSPGADPKLGVLSGDMPQQNYNPPS